MKIDIMPEEILSGVSAAFTIVRNDDDAMTGLKIYLRTPTGADEETASITFWFDDDKSSMLGFVNRINNAIRNQR